MSKRVADLVVETLQAAGVKTCHGIVCDTLNGAFAVRCAGGVTGPNRET